MANLRAIRKRIASVKNTRQITRAMKLVSGAKLKRASDAAIAARPYSNRLEGILESLLESTEVDAHPLFQSRPVKKIKVLAFTSDRGLCGSYNSSINRRLSAFSQEHADADVEFVALGRRGFEYLKTRGMTVGERYVSTSPSDFDRLAGELVGRLIAEFKGSKVDEVYLVFNRFRSVLSQDLVCERLLPLTVPDKAGEEDEEGPKNFIEYIYEPKKTEILGALLPQLVTNRVLQAFLEAAASEHGARMTAMDNATRNASEMISKLTLAYNRARQAAITRELVEIVSGAEAL